RQDQVLDLLQLESGKARRHAFEEILDVAIVSRYYANTAAKHLKAHRRRGALPLLTAAYEHRHPVGVVGIIAPWNYPLTLSVAEQAGRRLIGASMELGGKNAMIVLPDANLTRAVEGAERALFSNAGQLCISIERLYVHESIADEFTRRLTERVRSMKLGTELS